MGLFSFSKKKPNEGYRHLAIMTITNYARKSLYDTYEKDNEIISVSDHIERNTGIAHQAIEHFIKTGNHNETAEEIFAEATSIIINTLKDHHSDNLELKDFDDALFNVYQQSKDHTLKSAKAREIYLRPEQVTELAKKYEAQVNRSGATFYNVI